MKKLVSISILMVSVMLACSGSMGEEAAQSITKASIMTHIETLSSDAFMGRGTGTEGEQMAVDYIVSQFKEMGADPGVGDNSYVQPFPLLGQNTMNAKLNITRPLRKSTISSFEYFNDFVAWPANESEKVDVRNAELVYVGYGIQAPEENWDDFKGVDVKGKVIVIKNNDPEYDENMFGGKARLYYGRYTYKFEKAKEMGAIGAIIVHTTPTAGYGWNVVSNSWSRERFYVKSAPGVNKGNTQFNGWMTYESSKIMFEQSGLNLDELLDAADDPDFQPVTLKELGMSMSMDAVYRNINAKNVVAKIEGSDPELKDEYLLLTAHFDHLGITNAIDGDNINNGAEDNAAGVSVLLNMMRAYKSMQPQLKRSVLAVVVSAEEVGLLGSEYWAKNPTVLPAKVSGNINLDGTNVYGQTKDIVIIGYGRTTLSDIIVEEADKMGRVAKPDPHPENGIFYRSDHFNMAKIGIPAIFPEPGSDFIGKPNKWAMTVDSVSSANYHSVNDEINEYWDLTGALKDAGLFFKVGLRVLNDPQMQSWKSGDEFEAARKASLEN